MDREHVKGAADKAKGRNQGRHWENHRTRSCSQKVRWTRQKAPLTKPWAI